MTDEQREQARRAQSAYVEFLRWCVEYARRDKGLPSSTTADLEQDFAAFHGLTGENDFSLYQDFRAFLTDGKRAEFDKRRDDVCKAYHEQGIDAAVQRLEDEARYVAGHDFGADTKFQRTVKKRLERQSQDIRELRRKYNGETITDRKGGRPSCDHGDEQKLRVIHYAMSKPRNNASDYARHVFNDWKGARRYRNADSLRKATERFLANNGLPKLPTSADAHTSFVSAINANTVIKSKLDKI